MKMIYVILINILLLTACHNQNHTTRKMSTGHDSMKRTSNLYSAKGPTHRANNYLIEPGKRIGRTFIGEDAETLAKTLGRPDFSDAAMGKAWLIWYGQKRDEHNNQTELDVYITYKDTSMTSKVVKQIRITSSSFKINDSIHVYADLSTIKRHFPNVIFIEKYNDNNREISIYDDINKGIAFDIARAGNQQICTGIIVHEPGKAVNDVYIRLQPPKDT